MPEEKVKEVDLLILSKFKKKTQTSPNETVIK